MPRIVGRKKEARKEMNTRPGSKVVPGFIEGVKTGAKDSRKAVRRDRYRADSQEKEVSDTNG